MAEFFEGFFSTPQLTRWMDAMPRRFSCREFSSPADLAQFSALSYTAARLSKKGIRMELFQQGAHDLVVPLPLFPRFSGLSQYMVIYADKDLQQAELKTGICGEAFQLELVTQGLQGCWMTGNYRKLTAVEQMKDHEKVMAVMPFGVPKDKDGASRSKRKILTAFSNDDPTLWPYWAYRAAEAIRSAPSALNRQPWKMSFSGSTLSFAGHKHDSIDTGIAITHLLCAMADQEYSLRLASDNKTYLISVKDNHEPV